MTPPKISSEILELIATLNLEELNELQELVDIRRKRLTHKDR